LNHKSVTLSLSKEKLALLRESKPEDETLSHWIETLALRALNFDLEGMRRRLEAVEQDLREIKRDVREIREAS